MFGLVPLWWALGAFYLVWPLFGALLLAYLIRRGRVVLPSGTPWWLVFLALAVLSASQLGRSSAGLSLALRLAFHITALVVAVYVYTAARELTPWRRILRPLCLFWLALVLLGWVGVVLPQLSLTTPTESLLPAGITQAPFINDMVHLHASEYSPRALNPTYRPSAPYPYTNNWGSTYALLVPCVLGYLLSVRTGPLRLVLMVSLPLSLPPAFLTLNRGMFLSLGAGLLVLAGRAIRRGQVRVVGTVLAVAVLGWLATLLIPVGELIEQRTSTSDTTVDRASLYREVLRSIVDSPLLGYGAPVTVDTTSANAPVGTQGQFWLVMFSHGIPALCCFVAWFVVVAARLARARSAAGQWLAVVPVIGLVQLPFYGLNFHNLSAAFFAVGLALAAVDGPVRREAHLPAGGRWASARRTGTAAAASSPTGAVTSVSGAGR
ncbi:O-antigen ligase family protein [Plantactinospora sp. GCM10030261]|uniref:O-antigen ligase family protein n=1 Tax=Plantactinospora sp. GCM10030261 TaxID=3273420 RepID=UPI003621E78C